MDRASRVAVTGVLAPHAGAFREELSALGYTPRSAEAHLVLMKRLSAWLEATGVEPAGLTAECIEEFLVANWAQGTRFPKSTRGAMPLVSFLRRRGVVPEAPTVALTVVDELVERFRMYLVGERGLRAGTVQGYVRTARLFLRGMDSVERDVLVRLDASMVQAFILVESEHRSVASTKTLVTGLRALLRYFHIAGITAASLVGAVPTVSGWIGTWLPRSVDAATVKRLLASCDRRTGQGRRDYAVLVVLSRLGLRIGEVAALELDDIDWRRGELEVRGKAGRHERLPLPTDVGRALADYLGRGRPASEDRRLFLRVLAPHRGLSTGGLIVIVQSACRRAGLAPVAAHRLRHTVASDLLRAGAGLPEIGQLLRHRSPASTAIYASVDIEALRTLARPWPGARP
jgi:site-specific recombinase XerD